IWLMDSGRQIATVLTALCQTFVALADRSIGIVMSSYTHLQRAQPISACAEALAWAEMFERDKSRAIAGGFGFSVSYDEEMRDCPLGSGAIAGTSLPIDPHLTAEFLTFRRTVPSHPEFILPYYEYGPRSSIYHTATRDAACDFLYALAMISMHLS